ncbi:MAG: PorP/SprF family type IX secretion system membrane protein [Saprospiraceae bacterium]|nr:PorP/SprF family type IX secretion system membrane protein [Saprospiraceae bacterium]MDW8485002.1 PorP/SprF family type IX secretion system membrane protein [Saprospiraceae bacterium]
MVTTRPLGAPHLRIICALGMCILNWKTFAQDPIFSQFYAAPLQLNPAFVGSSHAPRAGAAYRNQWTGFSNAYHTYAVFYEQTLEQLNAGVGLNLEGDNAGDGILRTLRASTLFSYRLQLNKQLAVKIGAEVGMHQVTVDWNRLVFPDQLDPIQGPVLNTAELRPDRPNKSLLDVSAGLLLASSHFWLGVGLKHLNSPDQGILFINDNLANGLPLRYTIHGGLELPLKKSNKEGLNSFISPNVLFAQQGPYRQVNMGSYLAVGPVFGGVWFRHTIANADAVILLVGVRRDAFKLGFSYDLTVSDLATQGGGTYEMTLGIFFDRGRKPPIDWNDCGKMFR